MTASVVRGEGRWGVACQSFGFYSEGNSGYCGMKRCHSIAKGLFQLSHGNTVSRVRETNQESFGRKVLVAWTKMVEVTRGVDRFGVFERQRQWDLLTDQVQGVGKSQGLWLRALPGRQHGIISIYVHTHNLVTQTIQPKCTECMLPYKGDKGTKM